MRSHFTRSAACSLLSLILVAGNVGGQETVHFTVTADARWQHTSFDDVLAAINTLVGGQGDFHISTGDMDDRVWENRAAVDLRSGPAAIWVPGVGNHEAEDPVEMVWIRSEFLTGNNEREPLLDMISRAGPDGSTETTFSWDSGNVHFVYLNQYWNGATEAGSDVATDGDIVPELLAWLAADLDANTRPAVFVFGHEPAFPIHRHLNDSLNKYEANRDAFWALLEERSVIAYICGHTHVYSAHRPENSPVWQIDVGNAGNESGLLDGQTFLSVTVGASQVDFEICRNSTGQFSCVTAWSEPIPIILKDGFEGGDTDRW